MTVEEVLERARKWFAEQADVKSSDQAVAVWAYAHGFVAGASDAVENLSGRVLAALDGMVQK